MPTETGVNLLLRGFHSISLDEHMAEGSRIVNRLGGLALAIDQAASYIEYRQLPIERLGEFLKTYEAQRKKILEHTPDHFWEYGAIGGTAREKAISAFTTWEMSFQQLYQDNNEQQETAAHFLTISAFLASILVSERIFAFHWTLSSPRPAWIRIFETTNDADSDEEDSHSDNEVDASHQRHSPSPREPVDEGARLTDRTIAKLQWDHDQFWHFLHQLSSLSLLETISTGSELEGSTFSLHPLIRDWLQLRQNGRHRQAFTVETIGMIVSCIRACQIVETSASFKQSLLLHIHASIRNDAEFFNRGHHLGEDISTCDNASRFASFYQDQGQFDSCYRLRAVVKETRLNLLGPEHPDTLTSMSNLAWVLSHQGKYEAAEEMHREVLVIKQRVLGMEHPDTLTSMNNLASVLSHQGKYDAAEEMHREVLVIEQRVLGMEHPSTLTSMSNLAVVLSDQGKYEAAEEMLGEALVITQRVLGMEHPSTLTIMNNLVLVLSEQVLSDQGEYEAVEEMLLDRGATSGRDE